MARYLEKKNTVDRMVVSLAQELNSFCLCSTIFTFVLPKDYILARELEIVVLESCYVPGGLQEFFC